MTRITLLSHTGKADLLHLNQVLVFVLFLRSVTCIHVIRCRHVVHTIINQHLISISQTIAFEHEPEAGNTSNLDGQ